VVGGLWLACAVLLALPPARATERNASYLAALESISTEELQRHVDYLADEKREGREAGTPGGYAAGQYLCAQLKALGLAGAGTDGAYLQAFAPNYRNVLAKLEGSDVRLRAEVIVIGAHYDHIGLGRKGSASGEVGLVHPGADDNASGTAALLELAQALTLAPSPRRTLLLAFWDAEEKGMLGSKHWLAHPTLPSDHVKLLINLDMIGRLRNNRLLVYGTRSGYGLRRLVSAHNPAPGVDLDFPWAMQPNADHFPFFSRSIPVLTFHTGLHEQYHRPSDKPELIDAAGMRRVTRLAFALIDDLANRPALPAFRPAARYENEDTRRSLSQQPPQLTDRLGARWEADPTMPQTVRLTGIVAQSPAHRAGLRAGDEVVEFAGREIRSADDLTGAVAMAPVRTSVRVRRAGAPQPFDLSIELAEKPFRIGIVWRADDAEPQTAIVSYVVPGSPAARAGLQVEDRIEQINGRDFADDQELIRLLNELPSPIRLRVERRGQIRTLELRLEPTAMRRAA